MLLSIVVRERVNYFLVNQRIGGLLLCCGSHKVRGLNIRSSLQEEVVGIKTTNISGNDNSTEAPKLMIILNY